MARLEDINVGDIITVKFTVTQIGAGQHYSICARAAGSGPGDATYGIKPKYVSDVESPIKAGDRVEDTDGDRAEVLKIIKNGTYAVVYYDGGDYSMDQAIADLTKVA